MYPDLPPPQTNKNLPEHVLNVQADGIRTVKLIDATPIGINVRSTVATYANVHDELRQKFFARTEDAKTLGLLKQAIFRTTPANCAAPPATAPA